MDCAAVQPLLSPFIDGELDGSDREAVAVHVDQCSDCRQRLSELRSLSEIWSSAPPPEPDEGEWRRIARKLDRIEDGATRRFRRRTWVAAATVLLLCVSAGAAIACLNSDAFLNWLNRARDPVNLIDYLDGANSRQGKTIEPCEVCGLVDLRPLDALQLPHGYKLENCCIFCDGVVRYKYVRGDAEVIVLIYQKGHTVVHGNKPLLTFKLKDGDVKIAQCKKRVSGSWKIGNTAVSLIATSDYFEFHDLLQYVDSQLRTAN